MPLVSRKINSNVIGRSNVGVKKVEAKITQGPVLSRTVLGDVGNRASLRTLGKKELDKPATKSLSSIADVDFKKPSIRGIPTRPQEKENVKEIQKKDAKSSKIIEPIQKLERTLGISKVVKESITKPVDQLVDAFSTQRLNIEDIDSQDVDNPQLVSEYVNDIYEYMRDLEASDFVIENYLSESSEITSRMRTILVNWLVQVHQRFNLLQETLYLTIAIMDRYLQIRTKLPKSELQLVGVTSMFISSKYEEMYCPEVGDFAYITDKAFSKRQIIRMEIDILTKLGYNVSFPLPLNFLRRNSKAGTVDAQEHTLAKYLMELCLPEYHMCHYKPSMIAASCLYLSLRLLQGKAEWSDTLTYYSNYSEDDIAPVVRKVAALVIKSVTSKHQAVRTKYRASKFYKISDLPQLSSRVVSTLATGSAK